MAIGHQQTPIKRGFPCFWLDCQSLNCRGCPVPSIGPHHVLYPLPGQYVVGFVCCLFLLIPLIAMLFPMDQLEPSSSSFILVMFYLILPIALLSSIESPDPEQAVQPGIRYKGPLSPPIMICCLRTGAINRSIVCCLFAHHLHTHYIYT